LPAVHGAYSNWLAPHWSAMPRKPDRNRRNFEAHTKIYDAVLHRDPDKAEDMLRAHLDQAWRQVSSTFDDL
ncbi:MAG: FCD domain-containing protein, partial [Pseudomonadota bacterium]